jgi:flagellar biogenesis protein FliO
MCSKPLHAEFHSPVVFLRLLLHKSERLSFILVVDDVVVVGVLQNRIHDERAQPEEDEDEDEQREESFWNIQIVVFQCSSAWWKFH